MDASEAQARAARIRAIWAYSGLDQEVLAEKAGINFHRLRALLARTAPKPAELDEVRALAAAAGVPLEFADSGFTGLQSTDEALQHEVELLRAEVESGFAGIRDGLRELRAGMAAIPALDPADQMTAILRTIEDAISHTGRDIGRRPRLSKRATDLMQGAPPAPR